ncbi:hypothetical protein FB451DRAFT_1368021 [Mycena latifolia]|nr:hypothetical protein FB451DRAFT_1368021 [Mycena latifolia]
MRLMRITRGLDRSCVPQESTPGRIALNSGHLTATLTYRTLPNAHGGSAVADISHARICDSCCVGSYPSHFAIGFIRGDGERWGGRKQQNMIHAAVAPRGRRLLALMPPVPAGGRLTRRPAVHRDVGMADFLLQAGTPLQVRQERARQSGKDNKGAGLAYNQYKPLFDLLASLPLLALKYHQQLKLDKSLFLFDYPPSCKTPIEFNCSSIHVLCMKIETTRLTQLATLTRSFRWKRCVKLSSSTLLTTPPAFELSQKYFGIVFPWVEENGLIDDGSASTTTAPAVSAVAHLSFAGVQLAGVRDLDDVGIGVQRLKERDGLLGFGEGLGGGGNDEKDLFDLLDAVAAGEADEGFGGGKEEKKSVSRGDQTMGLKVMGKNRTIP